MAARSMTAGEITLATSVYKSQISYGAVQIHNRRHNPFQPANRAMAPNGNIYYTPGDPAYHADFSAAGVSMHHKATFIHELCHVWQHQHGQAVTLRGIFERDYDYLPLTTSTSFASLGIEEQASLVQDYFYLANGYTNPRWPAISVYISVIPWLP